MIAFLSLFLGLVSGPHEVQLSVDDPAVASVELLLDHERVVLLSQPPWGATVDFGLRLRPHRLEAIARDVEGKELGRVSQLINMPTPPAVAQLTLAESAGGSTAALRVFTRSGASASGVRLSLDGRPLQVRDVEKIVLPKLDLAALHYLRAEVDFQDGESALAELVFGGTYADTVASELTAVPLEMEGRRAPTVADLQGLIVSDQGPVEIVAVEARDPELVVVMTRRGHADLLAAHTRTGSPPQARLGTPLSPRIVWPLAARATGPMAYDLFPAAPALSTAGAGLFFTLARGTSPPPGEVERTADAVAVAGVLAAQLRRPRAVVLVFAGAAEVDQSVLTPELAARYLEEIQVPLAVWSTRREVGDAWADVEVVTGGSGLTQALRRLQAQLDRQYLVIVTGNYLPTELRLAPQAAGMSWAR